MLMSIGFHYYETIQNSLSLQWIEKERTPLVLGRLIAVGSFTSLAAFGLIYLGLTALNLGFEATFAAGGVLTVLIAVIAWFCYPRYPSKTTQHRHLVFRAPLLAVLLPGVFVRCPQADIYRIRRFSDGREVWFTVHPHSRYCSW